VILWKNKSFLPCFFFLFFFYGDLEILNFIVSDDTAKDRTYQKYNSDLFKTYPTLRLRAWKDMSSLEDDAKEKVNHYYQIFFRTVEIKRGQI